MGFAGSKNVVGVGGLQSRRSVLRGQGAGFCQAEAARSHRDDVLGL